MAKKPTLKRLKEIKRFEEWSVKNSLEYDAIKDLLGYVAALEAEVERLKADREKLVDYTKKVRDWIDSKKILFREPAGIALIDETAALLAERGEVEGGTGNPESKTHDRRR